MEVKKERKDNERKLKKHLIGTAAGALTAASLTVGALFDAPDELLLMQNEEDDASLQTSTVSVGKRLPQDAGQPGTAVRASIAEKLRAFLLRRSPAVRGAVLFPLWCVGKVGITALTALFHALSPFASAILGVLLNVLLLFLLFAAVYKLLFPNRSIKDLFKKRNFTVLLVGGLLLGVVDAILNWYYPDKVLLANCVKYGLGLIALIVLSWRLFGKKQRAKPHVV